MQNELSAAFDPELEFPWAINNPPTFSGGYSEISKNVINGEFDATIIEVAFHDNAEDADLLQDPKVRDAVGRAAMHTAIQYFQQFDGLTDTTYLPEPPTDVRATTSSNGNVTINWSPGPSSSSESGPYGNAATSYKVYTSTNGLGWDGGVTVTGATSLTFSGMPLNAPTYFRVTALNAGGESFGSPVVSAKPQAGREAPILVVNDFSRLDRNQDYIESNINLDSASSGTFARVNSLYNNSENYVIQAASAIQAFNPNLGIESCSASAIASGEISLSNYQTVIWMSGDQSSTDGTFTSTLQPLVTSYLNGGGKMFVSGSEIGWDLVAEGHGSSFFTNTLKANYPVVNGAYTTSDDANTYNAAGASGSIFAGISLSFDNGTGGTYNVLFPDTVATVAGPGHGERCSKHDLRRRHGHERGDSVFQRIQRRKARLCRLSVRDDHRRLQSQRRDGRSAEFLQRELDQSFHRDKLPAINQLQRQRHLRK